MKVTVYLIDSPEAPDVARDGPTHPVLGELIDVGTVALLRPPVSDSDTIGRVSGTPEQPVLSACERAGPDVTIVRRSGPLPAALRTEVGTLATVEAVFVVLLLPREEALVIAAGRDLPSMGRLPPCDIARFEASLLVATGRSQTDSLFTEPHPDFDAHEDRRLTERLRQLYGE